MTDTELRNWLDACTKMEFHVKSAKARCSWKAGSVKPILNSRGERIVRAGSSSRTAA